MFSPVGKMRALIFAALTLASLTQLPCTASPGHDHPPLLLSAKQLSLPLVYGPDQPRARIEVLPDRPDGVPSCAFWSIMQGEGAIEIDTTAPAGAFTESGALASGGDASSHSQYAGISCPPPTAAIASVRVVATAGSDFLPRGAAGDSGHSRDGSLHCLLRAVDFEGRIGEVNVTIAPVAAVELVLSPSTAASAVASVSSSGQAVSGTGGADGLVSGGNGGSSAFGAAKLYAGAHEPVVAVPLDADDQPFSTTAGLTFRWAVLPWGADAAAHMRRSGGVLRPHRDAQAQSNQVVSVAVQRTQAVGAGAGPSPTAAAAPAPSHFARGSHRATLVALNSGRAQLCVQIYGPSVRVRLPGLATDAAAQAAELQRLLPYSCVSLRVLQRLVTIPAGPLFFAPATHARLRLFSRQPSLSEGSSSAHDALLLLDAAAHNMSSAALSASLQPLRHREERLQLQHLPPLRPEEEISLPSGQFLWLLSNPRVATCGVHHGILDAHVPGETSLMVIDMHVRDRSTAELVHTAAACAEGGIAIPLADGGEVIAECSGEDVGGLVERMIVTEPAYIVMWLELASGIPPYLAAADALTVATRLAEGVAAGTSSGGAADAAGGAAESSPSRSFHRGAYATSARLADPDAVNDYPDGDYTEAVAPTVVTPFVEGVVGAASLRDVNPVAFRHHVHGHHNFSALDGAGSPTIHREGEPIGCGWLGPAAGASESRQQQRAAHEEAAVAAAELKGSGQHAAAAVKAKSAAETAASATHPPSAPHTGASAAAQAAAASAQAAAALAATHPTTTQQTAIRCTGFTLDSCYALPERPLHVAAGQEYRLRAQLVGVGGQRLVLGTNVRFSLDAACVVGHRSSQASSASSSASSNATPAIGGSAGWQLRFDPQPRPGRSRFSQLAQRYPKAQRDDPHAPAKPSLPWERTLRCGNGAASSGSRGSDSGPAGDGAATAVSAAPLHWDDIAAARVFVDSAITAPAAADGQVGAGTGTTSAPASASLMLIEGELVPILRTVTAQPPLQPQAQAVRSDLEATMAGATQQLRATQQQPQPRPAAFNVSLRLEKIVHPISRVTWRPSGPPLQVMAEMRPVQPLLLLWPSAGGSWPLPPSITAGSPAAAFVNASVATIQHVRIAVDGAGDPRAAPRIELKLAGGAPRDGDAHQHQHHQHHHHFHQHDAGASASSHYDASGAGGSHRDRFAFSVRPMLHGAAFTTAATRAPGQEWAAHSGWHLPDGERFPLSVSADGTITGTGAEGRGVLVVAERACPENGLAVAITAVRPSELRFRIGSLTVVRGDVVVLPVFAVDPAASSTSSASGSTVDGSAALAGDGTLDVCSHLSPLISWRLSPAACLRSASPSGLDGAHATGSAACRGEERLLPTRLLFYSGMQVEDAPSHDDYALAARAVALAEVPANACGVAVLQATGAGEAVLTAAFQDALVTVDLRVIEPMQLISPPAVLTQGHAAARAAASTVQADVQPVLQVRHRIDGAPMVLQLPQLYLPADPAAANHAADAAHDRHGGSQHTDSLKPAVVGIGSSVTLLAVGGEQGFPVGACTGDAGEAACRDAVLSGSHLQVCVTEGDMEMCMPAASLIPMMSKTPSTRATANETAAGHESHHAEHPTLLGFLRVKEVRTEVALVAQHALVPPQAPQAVASYANPSMAGPMHQTGHGLSRGAGVEFGSSSSSASGADGGRQPASGSSSGQSDLELPLVAAAVQRLTLACSAAGDTNITLRSHPWANSDASSASQEHRLRAVNAAEAASQVRVRLVCDAVASAEVAVQRESTWPHAGGAWEPSHVRRCRNAPGTGSRTHDATASRPADIERNSSVSDPAVSGLELYCADNEASVAVFRGESAVLGVRFYGAVHPNIPMANASGSLSSVPHWQLAADDDDDTASHSGDSDTLLGERHSGDHAPSLLQLDSSHEDAFAVGWQSGRAVIGGYGADTSTQRLLADLLHLLPFGRAGYRVDGVKVVPPQLTSPQTQAADKPESRPGTARFTDNRTQQDDSIHRASHRFLWRPSTEREERYWSRHAHAGWLLTGLRAGTALGQARLRMTWAAQARADASAVKFSGASASDAVPLQAQQHSVTVHVTESLHLLPQHLLIANAADAVGWAVVIGGCNYTNPHVRVDGSAVRASHVLSHGRDAAGDAAGGAISVFSVQPAAAEAQASTRNIAPSGAPEILVAKPNAGVAVEGHSRVSVTDRCVGPPAAHVEVEVARPTRVLATASAPFLPLGGSADIGITVQAESGAVFPAGQTRFMRPQVHVHSIKTADHDEDEDELLHVHSSSGRRKKEGTAVGGSVHAPLVLQLHEEWLPCSEIGGSHPDPAVRRRLTWLQTTQALQSSTARCLQPHYSVRAIGVGQATVSVSVQSCNSVTGRCERLQSDDVLVTVQPPIRPVPSRITLFPDSSFRLHVGDGGALQSQIHGHGRTQGTTHHGRSGGGGSSKRHGGSGVTPIVALQFPAAKAFNRLTHLLAFESSDPAVVTVTEDGYVTATGPIGEAVITIRLRAGAAASAAETGLAGGCPTQPVPASLVGDEGTSPAASPAAADGCSPAGIDVNPASAFTGAQVFVRVALPSRLFITSDPGSSSDDSEGQLHAIMEGAPPAGTEADAEASRRDGGASARGRGRPAAATQGQGSSSHPWLPVIPLIAGGSRHIYAMTAEGHSAMSGAGTATITGTTVELLWRLGNGTWLASPRAAAAGNPATGTAATGQGGPMLPWESRACDAAFALQQRRVRPAAPADGFYTQEPDQPFGADPSSDANAAATGQPPAGAPSRAAHARTFGHGIWVRAAHKAGQSAACSGGSPMASAGGASAATAYPVHSEVEVTLRVHTRRYGTVELRATALVAALPELFLEHPVPVSVHPQLSFAEDAAAGAFQASASIESPGRTRSGMFVPSMVLLPPQARTVLRTSLDTASAWLPPGLAHRVKATVISVSSTAEGTAASTGREQPMQASADDAPPHAIAFVSSDAGGATWLSTGACGHGDASAESQHQKTAQQQQQRRRQLAFLTIEESLALDEDAARELRPEDVRELRRLLRLLPSQSMTIKIVCEPIAQVMLEALPGAAGAPDAGVASAVSVATGSTAVLRALPADSWGRIFSAGVGSLCLSTSRHADGSANASVSSTATGSGSELQRCTADQLGFRLYSTDHYVAFPSFAFSWQLRHDLSSGGPPVGDIPQHGHVKPAEFVLSSAAAQQASLSRYASHARPDELHVVLHGVTEGKVVVQLYTVDEETPYNPRSGVVDLHHPALGSAARVSLAGKRAHVGAPGVSGDAVEVAVRTDIRPANVTVAAGGAVRFSLGAEEVGGGDIADESGPGQPSNLEATAADGSAFSGAAAALSSRRFAVQSCLQQHKEASANATAASAPPPARYRWVSSNPSVLKIDAETGCAFALRPGDAIVTVQGVKPSRRHRSGGAADEASRAAQNHRRDDVPTSAAAFAQVRVLSSASMRYELLPVPLDEVAGAAAALAYSGGSSFGAEAAAGRPKPHSAGAPLLTDPPIALAAGSLPFLHLVPSVVPAGSDSKQQQPALPMSMPEPVVWRLQAFSDAAHRHALHDTFDITHNVQFSCSAAAVEGREGAGGSAAPANGGGADHNFLAITAFAIGPGALNNGDEASPALPSVAESSGAVEDALLVWAQSAHGLSTVTEKRTGGLAESVSAVHSRALGLSHEEMENLRDAARGAVAAVHGEQRRARELADALAAQLIRSAPTDRFCVAVSGAYLRQQRPRGARVPFGTVLTLVGEAAQDKAAETGTSVTISARLWSLSPASAASPAAVQQARGSSDSTEAAWTVEQREAAANCSFLAALQLLPAPVLLSQVQRLQQRRSDANAADSSFTDSNYVAERFKFQRNPEALPGIDVTLSPHAALHQQAMLNASAALSAAAHVGGQDKDGRHPSLPGEDVGAAQAPVPSAEAEAASAAAQAAVDAAVALAALLPSRNASSIVAWPTLLKRPEGIVVLTPARPVWLSFVFGPAAAAGQGHEGVTSSLGNEVSAEAIGRLQTLLLPIPRSAGGPAFVNESALAESLASAADAGWWSAGDAADLGTAVSLACAHASCPSHIVAAAPQPQPGGYGGARNAISTSASGRDAARGSGSSGSSASIPFCSAHIPPGGVHQPHLPDAHLHPLPRHSPPVRHTGALGVLQRFAEAAEGGLDVPAMWLHHLHDLRIPQCGLPASAEERSRIGSFGDGRLRVINGRTGQAMEVPIAFDNGGGLQGLLPAMTGATAAAAAPSAQGSAGDSAAAGSGADALGRSAEEEALGPAVRLLFGGALAAALPALLLGWIITLLLPRRLLLGRQPSSQGAQGLPPVPPVQRSLGAPQGPLGLRRTISALPELEHELEGPGSDVDSSGASSGSRSGASAQAHTGHRGGVTLLQRLRQQRPRTRLSMEESARQAALHSSVAERQAVALKLSPLLGPQRPASVVASAAHAPAASPARPEEAPLLLSATPSGGATQMKSPSALAGHLKPAASALQASPAAPASAARGQRAQVSAQLQRLLSPSFTEAAVSSEVDEPLSLDEDAVPPTSQTVERLSAGRAGAYSEDDSVAQPRHMHKSVSLPSELGFGLQAGVGHQARDAAAAAAAGVGSSSAAAHSNEGQGLTPRKLMSPRDAAGSVS